MLENDSRPCGREAVFRPVQSSINSSYIDRSRVPFNCQQTLPSRKHPPSSHNEPSSLRTQTKSSNLRRHWCCPEIMCKGLASQRLNVDTAAFAIEEHIAIDQCEQGVVIAHADVAARVPLGTDLSDQNVAWSHQFTTELLHSTSLCVRIATVPCRSLTFFVCHCKLDFIVCLRLLFLRCAFSHCRTHRSSNQLKRCSKIWGPILADREATNHPSCTAS